MGTVYSPSPVRLGNVTLLDDGDNFDAGNVMTPVEGTADGVEWCSQKLEAVTGESAPVVFTAAGPTTWTAGPNDRRILLVGCGGGGGGGGGAQGDAGGGAFSLGGGGGGGAIEQRLELEVTPGTVYEVLIGAGGAGGAAVTSAGNDGGNGGDTIFRLQTGAFEIARFKGARGGKGGGYASGSTNFRLAPGGTPVAMDRLDDSRLPTLTNYALVSTSLCYGIGFGGDGTPGQSGQTPRTGADYPRSIAGGGTGAGGAGGAFGATSTNPGGGAGGGGAAGPYGNGSAGKSGGVGASGNGSPAPPDANPNVSPNTGAGGGGGGGGGSGGSGGGVGSSGRVGASGVLVLRVIG